MSDTKIPTEQAITEARSRRSVRIVLLSTAAPILIAIGLYLIPLDHQAPQPATVWIPPSPTPTPTSTSTSATSSPVPMSKWSRGHFEESPMDEARSVFFSLDAEEEINIWNGRRHLPTLIVRCEKGRTQAYINVGMPAEVDYRGDDRHDIRVRFDGGSVVVQRWGESTDRRALFASNAIALIRSIHQSNTMLFEFTPYQRSETVVRFDVRGFGDERLRTIATMCRWKSS